MVNFRFYDPEDIFRDDGNPEGMAGKANVQLAASFLLSRNQGKCDQCNFSHQRFDEFDRNAGAMMLYQEDGVNLYTTSNLSNDRKYYHCISYGNKTFKEYTNTREYFKATSYGHSERMLMRDILNDLILAEGPGNEGLVPKNNYKSPNPKCQEYEILKYLTDNAGQYKEYLTSKQIIVKMWSERPACTEEKNKYKAVGGGNCFTFMESICPERSQFGFIVKDYIENEPSEIEAAFVAFKNAYQAYVKDSKVSPKTSKE